MTIKVKDKEYNLEDKDEALIVVIQELIVAINLMGLRK